MPMLVHDFMHRAVIRHGDRPATTDARGTLSYRELWQRSARLAAGLQARGVQRGDRVAAVMNNRSEWVETDIATSMSGAVRCRLNARDGEREWALTLEDLAPRLVVSGPEFTPVLEGIRAAGKAGDFELLTLGEGGSYEDLIGRSQPAGAASVGEDDAYAVFHTSGTTGRYKGADYPHRAWFNIYRNILALCLGGLGHTDAVLHVGPLSHQSGVLVGPALYQGARSVMMERFDPALFFETVARERISHTILAPAIINMLASHPGAQQADLSSLKMILYSGAPISPAVLRRAMDVFGPIFLQGYGSTESGALYNTILYLAVRDGEGYITIVDRKNDMIVSGGLNVYPREVEDAIASHPGVREVAVIGVPDEKWGEAVMACIMPLPGAQPGLAEIQRHCREVGLASYKKPLHLELVDEIPKTAVGKLFRRALRERHWAARSRRVG